MSVEVRMRAVPGNSQLGVTVKSYRAGRAAHWTGKSHQQHRRTCLAAVVGCSESLLHGLPDIDHQDLA